MKNPVALAQAGKVTRRRGRHAAPHGWQGWQRGRSVQIAIATGVQRELRRQQASASIQGQALRQ